MDAPWLEGEMSVISSHGRLKLVFVYNKINFEI